MSAREVNQLQKDLVELENGLTVSDSTQQLKTELTNLRNKVGIYPLISLRLLLRINLQQHCRKSCNKKDRDVSQNCYKM